jgi:hypothetical protein
MARVLHLLKGDDPALARATVEAQVAAGDQVTVAVLHGAAPPALPPAVRVQRVPDELSYDALLRAIFEADQVVTW